MFFLQGEVFFFSGKNKISPYDFLKEKEQLRGSVPHYAGVVRPIILEYCPPLRWGSAPHYREAMCPVMRSEVY